MNKKILTAMAALAMSTSFAFAEDHGNGNAFGKNKDDNDKQSFKSFIQEFAHGHKQKGKDRNDDNDATSTQNLTDAQKLANVKVKASAMIDERIAALNTLNIKVQSLPNITAANKAIVNSSVQNEITALSALRTKINADTDLAVAKSDLASIGKNFRTYNLVSPKSHIAAKAGKQFDTLNNLATTSAALKVDIQVASSTGKDVTALNAQLATLNAKLADANVQSNTALSLVAPLQPDNGSSTVRTQNQLAITQARTALQIAKDNIQQVRSIATNIINQLKSWGVAVTAQVK
jgi:hypothetical protein